MCLVRMCAMVGLVCGLCAHVWAEGELWAKRDFAGAYGGAYVEKADHGPELVLPRPGAGLTRRIALKPEWRVLNLKGALKAKDVPKAEQSWQTARFALEWKDARGRTVRPWPYNHGWIGTTDWMAVDHDYLIPTNAAFLQLSLCNLSTGGEVRFRDVSLSLVRCRADQPCNAPLPKDVPADPESLEGAWHAQSKTRQCWSLNGYWRCRPVLEGEDITRAPGPQDNWTWARVPDVWASEGQRPFAPSERLSPWFEDHPEMCAKILPHCAWYARSFAVPREAARQRVALRFDMVARAATLYVDARRAGEVAFPGGEIDVTPWVTPGKTHHFVLFVSSAETGDTLVYNESRRANRQARRVAFPGLTGDVWLDVTPRAARLADAWTACKVADGSITFSAQTIGLEPSADCRLAAHVTSATGGPVRVFSGTAHVQSNGCISFSAPWRDARTWDTHTPHHLYTCHLSLYAGGGQLLDETVPFSFGFRDVACKGRDVLLNGKPVHLRALFDPTFTRRGGELSREACRAFCRNVQAYGFNAFIAGNYSFSAGDAAYLQGMLDACDETGMLYCFTLPHFKDFGDLTQPAVQARYREVTAGIVRLARRHPSVILWATSHNAAGQLASGDPDLIDGLQTYGGDNTRRRYARICRKIIGEIDPSRPCYHHESGNLDDFHTVNCYLDWAPIQERSDWLEYWSAKGVKPLFFVEWGLPHISTWSSYRGPLFIWRSTGYMSLWLAEFSAAYRNDAAYEATPEAYAALAEEEKLWQSPRAFSWSRLARHCGRNPGNYTDIQSLFAADNWRSFRGWGITAALPWDQAGLFEQTRTANWTDNPHWRERLKHPGWHARKIPRGWANSEEWTPTSMGRTMKRWNMPDCAWIGGGARFTGKRHHYRAGELVEKTLMIVNDRRVAQKVAWRVSCGAFVRSGETDVAAGGVARVPVSFRAPGEDGFHELSATFAFADGVSQSDAFSFEVLKPAARDGQPRLQLYDPAGDTARLFARLGLAYETLAHAADKPDPRACLVVGRGALTPAYYRDRVRPFAEEKGHVLVFEQSKEMLEEIGFRVQRIGLRRVFPRYRTKTLDAVLHASRLRDWAGASTLVSPNYPPDDARHYHQGARADMWAGYRNTRVWRCGNHGAVASVVPEKPAYGDFCALVDGGFDLQYAPLLEWRLRARGKIVFCQLDVTARTQDDPAADDLVVRLASYMKQPAPQAWTAAPYGMQAYASVIFSPRYTWTLSHDAANETTKRFFVTSGAPLPPHFFDAVRAGATALLCGLTADEVRRFSPVPLRVADTNGCYFTRIEKLPPELNGLSNADWAWHGAMDFAAFADADETGNAAFRVVPHGKGRLVFWQVPPWFFDTVNRPYLRTSKRRAEAMLSRLMGNLGFNRGLNGDVFYADVPVAEDDPYRYYHW